jgi:hypothetical protein
MLAHDPGGGLISPSPGGSLFSEHEIDHFVMAITSVCPISTHM